MEDQPLSHCYEFGPFLADELKRVLLRNGQAVPLTPKAFDTLLLLIQNRARILEKDELMAQLWPDTVVEENTLARNISMLRKALGETPEARNYIVTVPGRGYRFVAGVRVLEGEGLERVARIQKGWGIAHTDERETNGNQTVTNETINKLATGEVPAFEVSQDSLTLPGAHSQQETTESAERRAPSEDKEVKATPSKLDRIHKVKRSRRRVWLTLMSVTVLVSGSLFGAYKLTRPKPRVSATLKITKLTTTGQAHNPAISPDGKYVAFIASEAGGSSLWIRQTATASSLRVAPPSKASYQGLTFSPDGNYLYYAGNEKGESELALYQVPVIGGTARRLLTDLDSQFAISPDGQRAVFVRNENILVVASLESGAERTIATCASSDIFSSVAWSPDGQRIVYAVVRLNGQEMDAGLVEIGLEGGAQKMVTRGWNWIRQVAWLPESGGMLMAASDKRGSPTQLWQISYPGGEARRITTDLSSYNGLSLTANANALVATRSSLNYNLWLVPSGSPQRAEQITFGTEPDGYSGLAWTPDGKVVYSSLASGRPEIWVMEVDGSRRKQITAELGSDRLGLSVSPDGRYIVFVSAKGENWRGGDGNIWRIDIDGNNPKELTDVGLLPLFWPDGRSIFYRRENGVWTMPIDGGEPVKLTGPYSYALDISPDGKLIAYSDLVTRKVGVATSDGRKSLKTFDQIPSTDQRPMPRWTPDGRALSYIVTRDGISNIWLHPIDAGLPKALTDFKTERIHYYAWSRDGRYLACARGGGSSDVVMMSNFR